MPAGLRYMFRYMFPPTLKGSRPPYSVTNGNRKNLNQPYRYYFASGNKTSRLSSTDEERIDQRKGERTHPRLASCDACLGAVHERRYRVAPRLLLVPLPEHLLLQQAHPLEVHALRTGEVAQVGTLQGHLQHTKLVTLNLAMNRVY